MLIFITGPSGVGKSTLRDYYYKAKNITPLPALTTRPHREGETEIHKTISNEHFMQLYGEDKLCLVAKNHGNLYGYLSNEIENLIYSSEVALIEVDSRTAIEYAVKYNASIVRVIPSSEEIAVKKIETKRDDVEDRLKDFKQQMEASFLSQRLKENDIVFVNNYDKLSTDKFCELIDFLYRDGMYNKKQ